MSETMKYPHLLAPLVLPNGIVLRNRMTSAASTNNYTQADEQYLTEATISMIAERAKSGASYVTLTGVLDQNAIDWYVMGNKGNGINPSDFFSFFDVENPQYQNYLVQLSEVVHMYNSKIVMQIMPMAPWGYDVSTGIEGQSYLALDKEVAAKAEGETKVLTPDMIEEIIDRNVQYAIAMKQAGYDGVLIHMAYIVTVLGRLMNRKTNHRTDEYGGSLENRCRASLEIAERIKKACGNDFILIGHITGYDPEGWSIEECVEFSKLCEGKYDLFQIRHAEGDPHHPSSFDPDMPYPNLEAAAALKEAGIRIPIEVMSGFQDPDDMEQVLADGKADAISGARMWISNPQYGQLVLEGRKEDIVPCLRCNRCHRGGLQDIGASHCSVNPLFGYEHKADRLFAAGPLKKKKTAVVGGGPDGMRAAMYASARGHEVTLYEKSGELGGLLKHIKNVSFKWTHVKYLDYLLYQMQKNGVDIKLNTEATVDLLREEGYEAVIIAVGSEPIKPSIPGIDLPYVSDVMKAYDRTEEIGENVVIIGGGEVGVETGIYLAQNGRNVTVLEMTPMLASNATFFHYYSLLMREVARTEKLQAWVNARVTEIKDNRVVYVDKDGAEQEIAADSVIYAAGMKSKRKEALSLVDSTAFEWYMVGDCEQVGNLQKNLRRTYGTAMRL